jgi:hypothetical protein
MNNTFSINTAFHSVFNKCVTILQECRINQAPTADALQVAYECALLYAPELSKIPINACVRKSRTVALASALWLKVEHENN